MSVNSDSDLLLLKLVHFEANRKECSVRFPTSVSLFMVLEIILE